MSPLNRSDFHERRERKPRLPNRLIPRKDAPPFPQSCAERFYLLCFQPGSILAALSASWRQPPPAPPCREARTLLDRTHPSAAQWHVWLWEELWGHLCAPPRTTMHPSSFTDCKLPRGSQGPVTSPSVYIATLKSVYEKHLCRAPACLSLVQEAQRAGVDRARTHMSDERNFAVGDAEAPPRALQASECNELLDPTRTSFVILVQRQPGKLRVCVQRPRRPRLTRQSHWGCNQMFHPDGSEVLRANRTQTRSIELHGT